MKVTDVRLGTKTQSLNENTSHNEFRSQCKLGNIKANTNKRK